MDSDPKRPGRQAISVTPLRSMPLPGNSHASSNDQQDGSAENSQPSLLFFQSEPSEEQWTTLQSAASGAVRLSGSAAVGMVGPVLGKMDMGENNDTYIFRVSLPGVARESFACDVAPNGHVLIEGITTTGEATVFRDGMRFEMLTQNLCPPGHFSISFKLPGSVESQQLTACFGIDGVFEGVVKKK